MKRSSLALCAFVALAVLMYEPAAYAYIDPNTGGVIFQVLMPIVAVLVGFIAFAWNFVKRQTLLIAHAVWRCMVSLASLFIKKSRN
jgi:hypothetical protein